ncbi:hypothetical protein ALFP_3062 [Alcaligenes faecalis]|nr:hypothetical protein ALFP_3062 [Alcaligenes faecalis]
MATKAQQQKFINTADEHQQQIIKLLRAVACYRGLDQTWSDWVEMGAIAIANAVDKAQFEQREKRYLEIVAQYQKEEVSNLVKAFAHLVQCWEKRVATGEFSDVLGSTFMMMGMGNASTGQFFTPYEVSRLMAGMLMADHNAHQAQLKQQGFITLQEPACGAGGMVVAAIHALVDSGINYQQALHVTAKRGSGRQTSAEGVSFSVSPLWASHGSTAPPKVSMANCVTSASVWNGFATGSRPESSSRIGGAITTRYDRIPAWAT